MPLKIEIPPTQLGNFSEPQPAANSAATLSAALRERLHAAKQGGLGDV
jgi:hypothetical protein